MCNVPYMANTVSYVCKSNTRCNNNLKGKHNVWMYINYKSPSGTVDVVATSQASGIVPGLRLLSV